MKQATKLEKVIFEMMTENTGAHFLDSGGAYGRHHEKNAKKTLEDFKAEPIEKYTRFGDDIEREVSVFQYLLNFGIELDALCSKFNKINTTANNWEADCEGYGISSEAWEYLTTRHEVKILRTFNTYNGDSDLSQVLQGSWAEIDGESYIFLQVHGGCDVRGGYTDARLFKYNECECNFIPEYKSQSEIEEEINEGYLII